MRKTNFSRTELKYGLCLDHLRACLFLLFLLIAQVTAAQTDDYPYKIRSLTVDEGLSHTDANDICQDGKGFIWIATYFGLDRFDGNAVRTFYNKNAPLKNALKNRIGCVYPDRNGDIWLGTEDGLQRFEVSTERYVDYDCRERPLNSISKIYRTPRGQLFVLAGQRLRSFDTGNTKIVEHRVDLASEIAVFDFTADGDGLLLLTSRGMIFLDANDHPVTVMIKGTTAREFRHIAKGINDHWLIATKDQLFSIAPALDSSPAQKSYAVEHIYRSSSAGEIKSIVSDLDRTIWVNDDGKLICLDVFLRPRQTISSKGPTQALNSDFLSKIFIDRSKCLWICMFGGGVNYFDLNEKPFYTLQYLAGEQRSLSGKYVRCVLADGDDIWIGTASSGLDRYNKKNRQFTYYNSYDSAVRLKDDIISALTIDRQGWLWIGSRKGIEIFDRSRRRPVKPAGWENFPKFTIESLTTDIYGNIWFGNHTDQFGVIYKDSKGTYQVKYHGEGFFIFAELRKPEIMVSSTHGLKKIKIGPQGDIVSSLTFTATGRPNSLSSSYTYPITQENDSTFWIGTIGGGLNRLRQCSNGNDMISVYDGRYHIFNDVESLEIDGKGRIWMGGNGLQRFDPVTRELTKYDKNDGLQGNSFKVGASYKGRDGCLYFGGINGLNYFYPDQIRENTVPAVPRITDILINDERPAILTGGSVDGHIDRSIAYSEVLKIGYKDNDLVLFFSAMHFANPLKCKYRYRLVGSDERWRYTDGRAPYAAYKNIDHATFRFELQASNDDGLWSPATASLTITVTPPWYKTLYAKVVYVILCLSLLAGIYLYQAKWHTLKRNLEIGKINEKRREEFHLQREELHQQQLAFFTNISHEFRTPLTLIIGPLEHLLQENPELRFNSTYQLVLRNAKRLMDLITELMNFKKISDGVIKLQVRPSDIGIFCAELFSEFEGVARQKGIQYEFVADVQGQELSGLFDERILEKILFNLLNNSFKYTEDGGRVTLQLFSDLQTFKPSFAHEYRLLQPIRAEKYIYMRVADTGIGISQDSIANIFDRYYRISGSHMGSGIGLALVKSLAQLHQGDIYIYSERMAGTEIIIGIPWLAQAHDEKEQSTFPAEIFTQLEAIDPLTVKVPIEVTAGGTRPAVRSGKRILIVEDNQELLRFLTGLLEKDHEVYPAADGEQGLMIAIEKMPDLIISDVMMPKLDGIELCRTLKERPDTAHIPFMILSARNAIDSYIQGAAFGADIYLPKPLSVELLLLNVRNIFAQREVRQQKFLNDYLSHAAEAVQGDIDKDLFYRLIALVEANITSTSLDVDFLCEHLYVSRTKLYHRIKEITGQPVGELIRTIRLRKAVEIMTHEHVPINEVAYRVGMQSNSYFSRSFKREYGKSPLQFIRDLKTNPS